MYFDNKSEKTNADLGKLFAKAAQREELNIVYKEPEHTRKMGTRKRGGTVYVQYVCKPAPVPGGRRLHYTLTSCNSDFILMADLPGSVSI